MGVRSAETNPDGGGAGVQKEEGKGRDAQARRIIINGNKTFHVAMLVEASDWPDVLYHNGGLVDSFESTNNSPAT